MRATTSVAEQPDGEAIRAHLHGMWSAVAPGWAEHADYVDARGARITDAMLESVQPQPGDRVLELACGPGGVGLAAAERVAPGGEVLMSDVVPEMTAIAAERAAALGLANVSTRVLDLERIDEPDTSYDVVVCREGLMFAPDPVRAAGEITRVLRPGGRVALAVWGAPERNPWLGSVLDAVGAELGRPMPPPGLPGPFALDDPDRLDSLLSNAGLSDARVRELVVPLRAPSIDDWWTRTCALAGPLAQVLESLPAEQREAIRARGREAVTRYATPDGLEMPGLTLIASARRGR